MIEVRVGKKHDVDLGEVTNGQCGRSQAFRPECKTRQPDSDPGKKNMIRESWSNWTPAFDSPFVPEIGVPTASA
jgi:hypothetical protein